MAKAKGPARVAAEKAARTAGQRAAEDYGYGRGRVTQRVFKDDIARIRSAGGPKAVQAAKDLVARDIQRPILGGGRSAGKLFDNMDEALTRAMGGKVLSERQYDRLVKYGIRGLLSPAGLAEGVAGSAIRAMKDSGTYDNARNKMLKQAKGKVVKGTRKGERA